MLLTVIAPVACDTHFVGFLIPASHSFHLDLRYYDSQSMLPPLLNLLEREMMTGRGCDFFCFWKEEMLYSEGEERVLQAISLVSNNYM